MRRKALANASAILDERAAEVERLHDGARMFCTVRLLCRRPHLQAVVHDEHGHTVEDPVEVGRRVTEYFGQHFRDDVAIGLPAFKSDNQPLQQPIEASGVNSAMNKLNNARACGYDSLPGDYSSMLQTNWMHHWQHYSINHWNMANHLNWVVE